VYRREVENTESRRNSPLNDMHLTNTNEGRWNVRFGSAFVKEAIFKHARMAHDDDDVRDEVGRDLLLERPLAASEGSRDYPDLLVRANIYATLVKQSFR
jgi:hypothetical protein